MKKVIKTRHGSVVIDMPVSFKPDEQDKDGNVIGSIVWTSD